MSANGHLRPDELTPVQGAIYLANNTAHAWYAMVNACRIATKVQLTITAPFGGYRSLAAQQYMWQHRETSSTGQVAYPGHSVHGNGRCVDIYNWASANSWLRTNAATYGFTRTIMPSEPWHFQHNGSSGGGGGSAPAAKREDTLMELDGRNIYRLNAPGAPGYVALFKGYEVVIFNERDYRKYRDIINIRAAQLPEQKIVPLPDLDKPEEFFNLDLEGWNLMLAVHGGVRG